MAFSEKKSALRAAREAKFREERKRGKDQRRRERRCFWTPPFGHEFESPLTASYFGKCVECGKVGYPTYF